MKYHAKYVGKDAADKLAADAKQNGWAAYIKTLMQYNANPALPTVYPWIVKTPATDATTFVLERNPYSIWVDTDGNQLPYIGTVQHVNLAGTDVMALKAASGDLDYMELQFTIAQLPVFFSQYELGRRKACRLGAFLEGTSYLEVESTEINDAWQIGAALSRVAAPDPSSRIA